ncbi:DUF2975 domain-containing protein [Piscirickettsia litoralis]|uniref:DUF2975 domain-containing protein n=1 Tax=Piscirickettsia litoralis TaxID=1891921 RepID=A0ABX2ZZK9_9GAMM|nr:DUF2975 domain-containing protein [Piscirickettsia litoralis]ODN41829.1 hypothetical protein BGC07_01100 [Piscirickettsia litoralis]
MEDVTLRKIKRVSFIIQCVCWLIIIALPIPYVVYWLYNGAWALRPASSLSVSTIVELGYPLRSLIFITSFLPATTYMLACYKLIRIFKNYAVGKIFVLDNVRHYRHLGIASLLWAIFTPISKSLLSVLTTYMNPPGYRFFSLQLNDGTVIAIFIGLILIVISWVMREACQLKEQQELTI